jgi:hypothetical protein
MTTANPIKIKETIETYENSGNPSHPCNGQQILTVSVVEICPWVGESIVKNFGGLFDQDDAQVRSEALSYYKTQAAADIVYFDRYQNFVAKMDKIEWEF